MRRRATGLFILVVGVWVLVQAPTARADEAIVEQAPNKSPYAFCSITEATGKFPTPDMARYTITGACESGTRVWGVKNNGQKYDFNEGQIPYSWTADGTFNAGTKAVTESFVLHNQQARAAAGSVTSTLQCETDPWRLTTGVPCRSVVSQPTPDFPPVIFNQLATYARGLPLTVFLSPSQRSALKRQYDIAMAKSQKFDRSGSSVLQARPPATGPVTPGNLGSPADAVLARQTPRILVPASDATVLVSSQLVVKIQPPQLGATPVSELEFKWLDTPAGQPLFENTIPAVDTAKLVEGYTVDPKVLRLKYGRWEVRVRMVGQATPGPWSVPTSFRYEVTLPTQSQKAPSSPILKTPQQANLNLQTAGAISSQASAAPQCKSGFVWREAQPTDLVCVPPASRDRVKQENATAASRRSPTGGPYGPNTCLAGFVWREAFNGDVVCVTPDSRRMAKEENALSASRTAVP